MFIIVKARRGQPGKLCSPRLHRDNVRRNQDNELVSGSVGHLEKRGNTL